MRAAQGDVAPPGGRGEGVGPRALAARSPRSESSSPGCERCGAGMLRAGPPTGDLPRAGEVHTGVISLGLRVSRRGEMVERLGALDAEE